MERLQEWISQGLPCALATVIEARGPAPRKAGAKLVLNGQGDQEGSVGGGPIEHWSLQEARGVMAAGEPKTLRFVLGEGDWRPARPGEQDQAFPGAVTIFLEPVLPPHEVVLFGGGHIAERLARLCAAMGLPFRVYDERPEFARAERFPGAREVVCAPYAELGIRLFPASHCVVMTHAHGLDERVLEQLLAMPFLPYVGMVGSTRKVKGIASRLLAKGIRPGPNLYTPAGLALGGSLPGDIALAIMAEIKLVMEGGRGGHLRLEPSELG